jgi:hypothetical protein
VNLEEAVARLVDRHFVVIVAADNLELTVEDAHAGNQGNGPRRGLAGVVVSECDDDAEIPPLAKMWEDASEPEPFVSVMTAGVLVRSPHGSCRTLVARSPAETSIEHHPFYVTFGGIHVSAEPRISLARPRSAFKF